MPNTSGSRKRAGGARPSPKTAAKALRALGRSGLTDEQLAGFAATRAARIRKIRDESPSRLSSRERQLVESDEKFVRAVVEQQEGIRFLLSSGVRRSDIALATGSYVPSVSYWLRGHESRIAPATGPRAEKLTGLIKRARAAVRKGLSLEDREVLKEVLGVRRLKRHATGRRPPEEVERLREKMREQGFWPPEARASALATLIERGGIPKRALIKRLGVGRDLFYSLLNPKDESVMSEELIRRVREALDEPSLAERFVAAMTTILGPERIKGGFKLNEPEKMRVINRLWRETGLSRRHVRRILPPYPTKWEKRPFGIETVKKLERVAKRSTSKR